MKVDKEKLNQVVELLSRLIRSHGGGIELTGVTDEGVVSIRFTGMCVGCELKPMTAATAIRPALFELDGVTGVNVSGVHLSAEAESRITAEANHAISQHIVRIVKDTLQDNHETSVV